EFPERFGSLQHARAFMADFVDAYNHEHRHSGIGFHTPADVHFGLTTEIDQARQNAMQTAWQTHPERFAQHQLPKTLQLPAAAWINQPTPLQQEDTKLAAYTPAGLTRLENYRCRSPAYQNDSDYYWGRSACHSCCFRWSYQPVASSTV